MTRLVKNNCQVCFCARARSFVHAPGRIRSEKLRLIPRMCTCSGAGFGTSSEPNGDQVFVVPSDLHVSALQAPKVMSIFAYVQDLLSSCVRAHASANVSAQVHVHVCSPCAGTSSNLAKCTWTRSRK